MIICEKNCIAQNPIKNNITERNLMIFTIIAAVTAICLAIGCTKMIIPTYILTGYGILMMIIGLFVVLFADKLNDKK